MTEGPLRPGKCLNTEAPELEILGKGVAQVTEHEPIVEKAKGLLLSTAYGHGGTYPKHQHLGG